MKTNTKIREAEIREVQSRYWQAKLLNEQENADKLWGELAKLLKRA